MNLDLRSLAAARICLGSCLLYDCLQRFLDFSSLYSSNGVLPSCIARESFSSERLKEIIPLLPHYWLDSDWWQGGILALLMVAAVSFTLGWRTKFAGFLCWLLTISLHARNPMVLYGGHAILRLALFWIMFLPTSFVWSIDSIYASSRGGSCKNYATPYAVIFCFVGQLLMIYIFTALLKSGEDWRDTGDALFYAMSIESMRTPFGGWVADHIPRLMLRICSGGGLLIEEIVPLVAIFSVANQKVRFIAVTTMILFHLSIGILLRLGLFQIIIISYWIAILPGIFWDSLIGTKRNPPAIIAGASRCPLFMSVSFGAAAAYCLLWNSFSVTSRWEKYLPSSWRTPGYALRLDQHWGLFAPNVLTRDGWLVAPAKLSDGTEIDLINGGAPLNYTKPVNLASFYGNNYWREYIASMFSYRPKCVITAYVEWLERRWSEAHPKSPIHDLRLVFMLQDSRHPEDGIVKVQMHPARSVDASGKSSFIGDFRDEARLQAQNDLTQSTTQN